MPSAGRIVCLGDIMIDIHAMLPGSLALGSDTPAPISFGHGGSAANTAAWLGSLGVPCMFAGRVGADSFGKDDDAALHSHGVTLRVSTDPDVATGVCLVLVSPDGERTMIPSAGANATLTEDHLGTDLLTAIDHLHLSGYTLLNDRGRSAAQFALALAAEVGASVSVDAASAAPIRRVGAERFLSWLPSGSLLLANSDEVAALAPDLEQSAGVSRLVDHGLTVVIKKGPDGALLAVGDERRSVPADLVPVRDSTGAGDAFAAGLLAGRRLGCGLVESVRRGNALGARAVTSLGARPGLHPAG
jgi:sugar/nucleoside kinase (ribokinase family)